MPPYISEVLRADHVLDQFDSGERDLDRWLRESALHAMDMRTATSFVWQAGDLVLAGYFSLAAHLVLREQLPARIGRGSPDRIPAILLARLALDRSLHGEGLGAQLLWDAFSRAARASKEVAARLLVVDALSERAARFYEHFGFKHVPNDPYRLVTRMSNVTAALDA